MAEIDGIIPTPDAWGRISKVVQHVEGQVPSQRVQRRYRGRSGGGGAHKHSQIETIHSTSTTEWTVPDGVRRVIAIATGGGGGGAAGDAGQTVSIHGEDHPVGGHGGGGGGGGATTVGFLDVEPGQTWDVTIGAGGAGGAADDGNGSGGADTKFSLSVDGQVDTEIEARGGGGANQLDGGNGGLAIQAATFDSDKFGRFWFTVAGGFGQAATQGTVAHGGESGFGGKALSLVGYSGKGGDGGNGGPPGGAGGTDGDVGDDGAIILIY